MDTFSFDLICFVFCFSLFSQSEQIDDWLICYWIPIIRKILKKVLNNVKFQRIQHSLSH
jgi:hypothetical protein